MSAFLHRGTSLTIFGAIDHRDLVSLSVRLSVGQQETKVLWTMKCVYFKVRWNEFLALLQFYFLSS